MSKELTPLQALNDLIEGLEDEHLGLSESEWVVKRKQIIEEELKVCEMEHTLRVRLENINYELVRKNDELKKMIKNFNEAIGEPQIISPAIEKKLKALEIIKDKVLPYVDTLIPFQHLTKEDIKILKEVLK